MDRSNLESLFQRTSTFRCLVVGDLMLDEYVWGKAERISPEAPVQVVDVMREELTLGGAGNVANNLLALGCQVTVAAVIGDDDDGKVLMSAFAKKSIGTTGIFLEPGRRTGRKTRVIAASQQIIRFDRKTRGSIAPVLEAQLDRWLQDNIGNFDVVLVSDYLKGVLTDPILKTLIATAKNQGLPVLIDPKGGDYRKYYGATMLTPNRKEAETASGVMICDDESLKQAADTIIAQAALENLLITRSDEGMTLFSRNSSSINIPTVAREVFDVTGAGDTVLSMLACCVAGGFPLADAVRLANIAAGIAVGKIGTSTVTPTEIVAAVAVAHQDSDTKIKNRDVLAVIIQGERARGKRVVFTNGCFDLLHVGHVKYLQAARKVGDLLVLGLNSDASVRRLKGPKRPLINEDERAHILAALDCINYVTIFDEETPLELITLLKPNILVKGGDYAPEGVVGKEVVEANGGTVEIIPFVDGKSTTKIIEMIRSDEN